MRKLYPCNLYNNPSSRIFYRREQVFKLGSVIPSMSTAVLEEKYGLKWNYSSLFSLILTLTALDRLFDIVLFLVGILFIISVTGHHNLSLVLCLPSPARLTQPRLFLPPPRPLLPTPGRYYPSPAVPCSPPHFC